MKNNKTNQGTRNGGGLAENIENKETYDNEMSIILKSDSKNEGFARVAVAGFIAQLDPTLADLSDIKTAVSEAVTNAIIHGYEGASEGEITLTCKYRENEVYIEVKDAGVGIKDIAEAREPLYTSKPEMDRSGLGFTVMENFMDEIEVVSHDGVGTIVKMMKKLRL